MSRRAINCTPSEVERLLHHMPTVAAFAENDWTKGFAQSVTKQSRRKGWWPSDKQIPLMRQMVNELFTTTQDMGGDFDLIEG